MRNDALEQLQDTNWQPQPTEKFQN